MLSAQLGADISDDRVMEKMQHRPPLSKCTVICVILPSLLGASDSNASWIYLTHDVDKNNTIQVYFVGEPIKSPATLCRSLGILGVISLQIQISVS
jgi:hypothetical protein